MIDFSAQEKEAAFDAISSCFYEQNFSTLGKADFELLMFHILLQHLQTSNQPTDDYSISKLLGITQQRIRNLKIKHLLRYGQEQDWKEELANTALQHPHYSNNDQIITLSFDDPNVMIEVQHFIEENGGFIDFSFNPKLLRMKTEDFAQLMITVGLSKNEAAVYKKIRTLYREETSGNSEITKESIPAMLKNCGVSFCKMIIENTISCILGKI